MAKRDKSDKSSSHSAAAADRDSNLSIETQIQSISISSSQYQTFQHTTSGHKFEVFMKVTDFTVNVKVRNILAVACIIGLIEVMILLYYQGLLKQRNKVMKNSSSLLTLSFLFSFTPVRACVKGGQLLICKIEPVKINYLDL